MALRTQEFLEIENIKDGVVVLKNKSLRGIILVSATNFALKTREEQEAIIFQFQNFLNSLDFPIQILVQSRRINLTGYFHLLRQLEQEWMQKNELMANQTREYRKFLEKYVLENPIMTKNFYVVVPYYVSDLPGFSQKGGKKEDQAKLLEEKFEIAKTQLLHRMEFVILGLRECGLDGVILGQRELIELFWAYFHPKESEFGYFPEIPREFL